MPKLPIFVFAADNEFVFINFYADWCRFSNMLSPIWDEAAEKAEKEFPEKGKVVFAKVDCDKHSKSFIYIHTTLTFFPRCFDVILSFIFVLLKTFLYRKIMFWSTNCK